MSDSIDNLEQELRNTEPRGLSPDIRDHLTEVLTGPRESSLVPFPAWRWLTPIGVAAAVFTVILALPPETGVDHTETTAQPVATLSHSTPTENTAETAATAPVSAATRDLVPSRFDTVLMAEADEGVVMTHDSNAVRIVRYDLMDRMEWAEKQRPRQRVQVVRPRKHVMLVGLNVD